MPDAIIEQQIPQTVENATQPEKKGGKFSSWIDKIRRKAKDPNSDPHETLKEMSQPSTQPEESSRNIPENDIPKPNSESVEPQSKPNEFTKEENTNLIKDPDHSQTPNESIPPSDKEREEHFKKLEPTYKIDEICKNLTGLKDIKLQKFNDLNKKRIEEGLRWIAETPERTETASKYIISLETILQTANTLPNLTPSEVKNLKSLSESIKKIKLGIQNGVIEFTPEDEIPEENLPITDSLTENQLAKALEYAYHATGLLNINSIAENGLQPSGRFSKEPGTVFYNAFPNARGYLIPTGFLTRTHITNVPEFAEYLDGPGGNPYFNVMVDTSRHPVPAEALEYSLDGGITWRKDLKVFKKNEATTQ